HWHAEGAESVAIFAGPHAYISPSFYATKTDTGKVVPTWNYEILNVYGSLVIHDDADWLLDLVTKLTNRHEAARPEPWQVTDAPESYTKSQLRGIVGIELAIAKVEGKAKMSQNQPDSNRAGVIAGLRESDAPQDQLVADRVAAFEEGNTKANGRG
ncbi:MAG TPA: FMN-binding negative transcriptional regulator, partial [Mycobacterium sp.]|nr:FMN-binding negative transcriptional regulator [Mycobacterium sp.]